MLAKGIDLGVRGSISLFLLGRSLIAGTGVSRLLRGSRRVHSLEEVLLEEEEEVLGETVKIRLHLVLGLLELLDQDRLVLAVLLLLLGLGVVRGHRGQLLAELDPSVHRPLVLVLFECSSRASDEPC